MSGMSRCLGSVRRFGMAHDVGKFLAAAPSIACIAGAKSNRAVVIFIKANGIDGVVALDLRYARFSIFVFKLGLDRGNLPDRVTPN